MVASKKSLPAGEARPFHQMLETQCNLLLKAPLVRQILQNEKVTVSQRKIPSYAVSCLMALSLLSVASSTLVEFPKNTIILQSESFKMIDLACKSDSPYNLSWLVQRNQVLEKEMLYNGYDLQQDAKAYCTVITDQPGTYSLLVSSVPEAAQTYFCLEPVTVAEVSADLIWLGDLTCSHSATEDLLNLTCSVEFRGNWAPMMQWEEHSSYGEKVLSVEVYSDTVPNQRVTSTLVVAIQNSGSSYTCRTKFDISGKPSHTTATNVPDYNRTWTFPVLSKGQDEPLTTLIVAAAITVSIAIAAILILLPVLFICRKNREGQNQEENQGENTVLRNQSLHNEEENEGYRSSKVDSLERA